MKQTVFDRREFALKIVELLDDITSIDFLTFGSSGGNSRDAREDGKGANDNRVEQHDWCIWSVGV